MSEWNVLYENLRERERGGGREGGREREGGGREGEREREGGRERERDVAGGGGGWLIVGLLFVRLYVCKARHK